MTKRTQQRFIVFEISLYIYLQETVLFFETLTDPIALNPGGGRLQSPHREEIVTTSPRMNNRHVPTLGRG